MCGIVGLVSPRRRGASAEAVAAMADVLAHRGPDDHGLYVDEGRRAALGFRRLSIIDLAGGHQPMANEDGSLRLVFNGEIYNYRELRGWLEARGHRFATSSDSETILHAYEELGDGCVERLRGMFALAIWDAKAGRLFAARDRLGIKPLYWTVVNGDLLFASEIKSLLRHPGVRAELDEESLHHYLTFLCTPAPATMFRGIQKLPAGHTLSFDGDGAARIARYWDAIVPTRPMDEAEAVDRTRGLIEDAVRSHMVSDVPFGAFLSGGVDSSTNVALMSRFMDRPSDTFSVGFVGTRYQEFEQARVVADLFGTNHREARIDFDDALDYLPEMVYHQDEPLGDPVCVPLYFVSRLMRDSGVVVGHVGEGADEVFFGYTGYMRALQVGRLLQPFRALPPPAWRAAQLLARPVARLTGRGGGMVDALGRLGRGESLFWGGAVAFGEPGKAALLRRPLPGLTSHDVVRGISQELLAKNPEADLLQLITYQDMRVRLPELLLMRVDKITMSTSIEARVPFLDHPLVEHALSIPSRLKVQSQAKHVLKRAVEDLLPREIVYRRKQGFDAPTAGWFRGQLGEAFDGVIGRSAIAGADLIDPAEPRRLVAEHRAARADHSVRLWGLLNLVLWYERWIANRDVAELLAPVARAAQPASA
jgi:asparagine synthase (glutamine-hydrolysing)